MSSPAPSTTLRIERAVYGGNGLGRTSTGETRPVPFSLPGELVAMPDHAALPEQDMAPPTISEVRILEPSPQRSQPHSVHFGACGGCQYQMAAYPLQMAMKETILHNLLAAAGIHHPPAIERLASPEPYGYRNRIRLRVRLVREGLQVGYSVRGTNDFLPVTMCPIAAPLLWSAAQAVLAAAKDAPAVVRVFAAVDELELLANADELRLQMTLLSSRRLAQEFPKLFITAMAQIQALCPALTGAGWVRVDSRSGRVAETIAAWGATGLPYTVNEETYWISRGAFFQGNRFLLPQLVHAVCGQRSGKLAWDLFAGVGLFSRVLAHTFGAVTAVEAHPAACGDLRRALAKLGPQHRAVEATPLDFLRRAVLERERPELIVLDPPRAGAGEEACHLLAQLAPAEVVYLSCDPTTLARDLTVLTRSGYGIASLHLIDLFPQTYHLETLAVLRRTDGAS